MQRLSKYLLWVIGSLVITFSVKAQEQHVFSVEQAVSYGIKNSTTVKKALVDIKIQNEVNREITAAAYPNLSASASFNYFPNIAVQLVPDFISGATYGVLEREKVNNGSGQPIVTPQAGFGFLPLQFGTKYNASADITISQLLFEGQVFVGLQARSAAMNLYRKQLAITEEAIKTNIHKIYWQLVIARKQLESFDANIVVLEKFLDESKELYKSGFREKLDIDKVTVQLVNLKTEKNKVENQIATGYSGLKFLLGMPQKDQLTLTDSITESSIKEGVLTDNNYQYSDRKEYQAFEIAQKLQQYNVKRYKYSYLPSLALFGSYSRNAQRNEFNFFKSGSKFPWFKSSVIGVKLSVPIFDGFAKDARIKKAKFELEKTKLDIENFKQNIDYDVTVAQNKIKNAVITMDYQKQNSSLAQKVYETEKLKYEQGLGSNLEVLNAQASLKSAQINYYASIYDAIIAKIDYLKAIGKL